MQLSRGWYGLFLFWMLIISLAGIGAGTLQMLGPVPHEETARLAPADPALIEFASHVPMTHLASAADNLAETSAHSAPEQPAKLTVTIEAEVPSSGEPDATPLDAGLAIPNEQAKWADGDAKTNDPAPLQPHISKTRFHLRIVRDGERCPKVVCYKWHLLEQHLNRSRPAGVDLATLRLPPSIREAAENGKIELIVDAVEHHKTINGRDRVIFVATNLAGVMPHDGAP